MIIESLRVRPALIALALGALVASASAVAAEGGSSDADEARAYHEKAKAEFALSHYDRAAEFFEKAFELKADPALLYNAAQSHRLAGNKQRALTLYQNYLRVYGRDDRRAQIEQHINDLKKAIEKDRSELPVPPPAGWPPGTTGPSTKARPSTESAPSSLRAAEPAKPLPVAPPAPSPSPAPAPIALAPMPSTAPPPAAVTPAATAPSSPTLLTQSSSGESPGNDDRSITQKPWFWVAVGGGVAAAAAVVLLLTLSKAKDPTASYGQINGN